MVVSRRLSESKTSLRYGIIWDREGSWKSMTATWDLYAKDLLTERPQDFATLVLPGSRYIGRHESQYQMREIRLDRLIEVEYHGYRLLINVELQSTKDTKIGVRLLEYSLEAMAEYGLPVLSCVIYLQHISEMGEPPLSVDLFEGRRMIWFDYISIELAEMTTEELRQMDLLGLLPLFILSKGGRNFDVLEEVVTRLNTANELGLLALTRLFADVAFTSEHERAYISRRFMMLQDIESTPEYQRLIQKGLEQGKVLGARQLLLSLVQARFPSLVSLAEKQLAPITDLELLHQGVSHIGKAKTVKEAQQYLKGL